MPIEHCRDIVRQLWPYLDGALADEWQERIARHLDMCDACRSHYDFERSFLEAIRNARPNEDEYVALRDKVLTALAADGMKI